jgi:hypothetical protein
MTHAATRCGRKDFRFRVRLSRKPGPSGGNRDWYAPRRTPAGRRLASRDMR